VGQIRAALEAAIDEFLTGKWQPVDPEETSDSSESGENFDLDGDESGWEDED